MTVLNETYTLNNGIQIPKLGLGTWLIEGKNAEDAVYEAIRNGYRMIDTAQAYGNEEEVGKGIARAIGEGLVKREDLFIGTKVAAEAKDHDSAAASITGSLRKLGLDYVDQFIIHSPQPWVDVNQSEDRFEEGNIAAYTALEEAYRDGRIKAIGVSNFLEHDLQNILDHCEVVPAVNQVLCHISNTPKELIDFCADKGIRVEAYSPIAHGAVLKNPEIQAVADRYHVSVAQLCIRYVIQLGTTALPKTANPEHMKDNADVNFEISAEDMDRLLRIEHIKDYGDSSFFPVFGGKISR
jgi:diketogulonate reductase-like aldo/keto reductase